VAIVGFDGRNDFKFIANDPWAPSAYLEYLERAVEVLLEEGRRGESKMLNVGEPGHA
jgi:hypothetical protein